MAEDFSFREMMDVLKRATEARQLRWEKTPDPLEFKAQLPDGASVRFLRIDPPRPRSIVQDLLEPAKPQFTISVRDREGKALGEWSAVAGPAWALLNELHQLVQRSVNVVDDRLRSILETLKANLPEKIADS